MAPGVAVQIRSGWRTHYRVNGSAVSGLILSLSPSGVVARVRMDEIADSYVLVSHLEHVGH